MVGDVADSLEVVYSGVLKGIQPLTQVHCDPLCVGEGVAGREPPAVHPKALPLAAGRVLPGRPDKDQDMTKAVEDAAEADRADWGKGGQWKM